MATSIAAIQFRAEPQLLEQVKEAAAKYDVSINLYLAEAVKARLAREKEQEWRAGFEAMARDGDVDVEYAIPAACEVIFGS